MELKEELENILFQLGFENPELEIEMTKTGRVGGFVISESFSGKSQIERQNMLWNKLDRILDEEKRLRIVGLLTMTPAEAEEAEV
jgi:acid stress-induced BolA-like protein IbaG/YrbA